ncbi:MAG: sigma-54-dependent Fis family transcriptional regulator [Acidobacteria bacterium]|nr:sigma-54-dependent Fis family transcriptional regulator [Acidobacteriota bacterium]
MPIALVVEDDEASRMALGDLVRREGFDVGIAASLSEARALLESERPDVILCDLRLPDGLGTELLVDSAAVDGAEFILVTGNATVESAVEALRLGAHDYLTKPVDVARLRSLLAGVRRTRRLRSEVSSLRSQLREMGRFGPMVGASPAMQTVYTLVEKVAPSAASVLIFGESGTGKELVARSIHDLSARSSGPFVPINCGAISASLMESELFGHEKGSFTGAAARKKGLFEIASGGTLFLDEVTEMPPELQVKLLRALETGEFLRVGGTEAVTVDVRIVASTNRVPEDAVEEGKLRQDLYYRLRGFPIGLPPLRARDRDVEEIAAVVLEQLNADATNAKELTGEALEAMRRYSWPGNVRELRNAMQQAFLMAGERIDAEHLPSELRENAPRRRGTLVEIRIGTSLDDAERLLIDETLVEVGGDKKRAAEILGISLKTLYNKLKRKADEEDE